MELDMVPQPTLENATCPVMPTALGPLGRSKRTCRVRWKKTLDGQKDVVVNQKTWG